MYDTIFTPIQVHRHIPTKEIRLLYPYGDSEPSATDTGRSQVESVWVPVVTPPDLTLGVLSASMRICASAADVDCRGQGLEVLVFGSEVLAFGIPTAKVSNGNGVAARWRASPSRGRNL